MQANRKTMHHIGLLYVCIFIYCIYFLGPFIFVHVYMNKKMNNKSNNYNTILCSFLFASGLSLGPNCGSPPHAMGNQTG